MKAEHEEKSRTPSRTQHLALASLALIASFTIGAGAQTMKAPDISKVPTLYVVPYAHLDTQWRWDFQRTIGEYLPNTMRVNFDYFDKYPHYVFNWTGANRYRLMKEFYPADYARIRKYVAAGRWFPAGSSIEEGDVNLPGAEGIFRQILYGNEYFRKDFGKASNEFMLPDCFGFPASLPSILAHAGIKGFSTQKLSANWQPAPLIGGPGSPEDTPLGIPFNVGMWLGPDGKGVVASLNPGSYTSNVYTDLTQDTDPPPGPPARNTEVNWYKRIKRDGDLTGIFADFHYIGTGDIGGAARESSVRLLEAIVTRGETTLPLPPEAKVQPQDVLATPAKVGGGPVFVLEAAANQMFEDITPAMTGKLPVYRGDLELINHSAGSLTSQAYHKRWVLQNELLADAAEKSSVAAAWIGARPYPLSRLNDAWMLSLAGHFHDIGAGTGTPRAYQFAWNDDLIAANQFSGIFSDATQAVAAQLDTRGTGTAVLVFNPLNIEREDIVEAAVVFANTAPETIRGVRVFNPQGREVPAQWEHGKAIFLASVSSVGYAVYDIVPSLMAAPAGSLKATSSSIENERYRVSLDDHGDVAAIYDKTLRRELLSGPMRLAISTDVPSSYPAWNMDFPQEQAAPRAYVGGTPKIRIKEQGPARVSLEVTRTTENSVFVQTVSLAAGDAGNRVEFQNSIDWRTTSANLKAVFPFSASNPNATYNWEIGTIERPNAQARQFEVGSHHWLDLSDQRGTYGTMVLTDVKNGSDKPDDHTVRLTLIRSPGTRFGPDGHSQGFTDQATQDWGHHEILFGITGHPGDWRQNASDWQAYRLNDPPLAFQAAKHPGTLGKTFSLLKISNPRVRVLALKMAESTPEEIVVRMVEIRGTSEPDVSVSFPSAIISAREVDAQEHTVGPATVQEGVLRTSFNSYQPRTFALRLAPPAVRSPNLQSKLVALHYDIASASNDDTRTPGGGFDGNGNAMPAEMLPATLEYDGVPFYLAHGGTNLANAVVPRGQTIALPAGRYNRVFILASSAHGDQKVEFRIGSRTTVLTIQDWGGFIGQWDTRLWTKEPEGNQDWAISASHPVPASPLEHRPPATINSRYAPRYPEDFLGVEPGYLKPAGLAWFASHQHNKDGLNLPYHYSYLFAHAIEVELGQRTLKLPENPNIRIFAISVSNQESGLVAVTPFFDAPGATSKPSE